jgi:hypothetical protein
MSKPALEQNHATLGASLFLEIEQSFETVGGIAEGFGLPTLVDLWWLANVIVANPGEQAIQSPGSRLRELVARLPSAPSFVRYIASDDERLV